jgi:hypothetical protein
MLVRTIHGGRNGHQVGWRQVDCVGEERSTNDYHPNDLQPLPSHYRAQARPKDQGHRNGHGLKAQHDSKPRQTKLPDHNVKHKRIPNSQNAE